jgi:hypothetical protein
MRTIVDLYGLHYLEVRQATQDVPDGPPAGSILVVAGKGGHEVVVILPRKVALSLHRGLDPWARAITEENDNGPQPSAN